MSSVARIWQPDDQQDLGDTVFFSLSKVLGLAPQQAAEEAAGQPPFKAALIVPLRQRQIGVYVDEVLTDREVVIKRLHAGAALAGREFEEGAALLASLPDAP